MRQARATLTCGSPTLGDGVVSWWSKAAWRVSAKVSLGEIFSASDAKTWPMQRVAPRPFTPA